MLVTRALAPSGPIPGNRFEPFAHVVAPVPGKNASASFQDLTLDQIELRRQCHEAIASFR